MTRIVATLIAFLALTLLAAKAAEPAKTELEGSWQVIKITTNIEQPITPKSPDHYTISFSGNKVKLEFKGGIKSTGTFKITKRNGASILTLNYIKEDGKKIIVIGVSVAYKLTKGKLLLAPSTKNDFRPSETRPITTLVRFNKAEKVNE